MYQSLLLNLLIAEEIFNMQEHALDTVILFFKIMGFWKANSFVFQLH